MTSRLSDPEAIDRERRRRLLATLGLGVAAAYVAPALFTVGQAQARGSGDFRVRASALSHFRGSFTGPSFTRPSFSHPHHHHDSRRRVRGRHRHADDRLTVRYHLKGRLSL